jgi:hypothetical protein
MPAFFPRRFTNPEFLRSIAPENLMAFLSPFREYLAGRGLALAAQGGRDVDYQALIGMLINPDGAMPKELVDGLYYVHEMSTPEAMNLLLEKAPKGLLEFGDAADEARSAEVRKQILRLEKLRLDEKALRAEAGGFDRLWKVMILEEQIRFVRHLVEKVGYDGRTGKVRVSFKSAGIKELCQKGIAG